MIGTPEADDKESRMNVHSIVGSASYSLAKECKLLCGDEVRVNGVKEHRKHKKEKTHLHLKKEFITYKITMMLRW